MKNIILTVLALFLFAGPAMAKDYTYTAPDTERFKTAFIARYPNTECAKSDMLGIECIRLKYTEDEWIEERIRRFIRNSYEAGERRITRDTAYKTITKDHDAAIIFKKAVEVPVK